MNRPWIPLNIADYLRDTSHLRALESGAYLHLIMAYWVSGKLPNDDRQLATITKLSDREWKALRPCLEAFFGEGFSSHRRIDKELAKVAEISNKRRSAVEQREIKRRSNDASSDDTLNTEHITKEESKDSGAVAPKAGRAKRERKYASALPGSFEPNYEAGTRVGLSRQESERNFLKFKNHAAQTGRTCVNWQAAWANWCINAAEMLGKPPPGVVPSAAATITPLNPTWNIWKSHFRDTGQNVRAGLMDKSASDGKPFTVPSEYPPGFKKDAA